MFSNFKLPAPKDWQAFERLCHSLWSAIWKDKNAQLNGRSGQQQHGVDVFGKSEGEPGYSGVQCKRRDDGGVDDAEITEKELRAEVQKALKFIPRITGTFILATTAPRDAKIQAVARHISEEHEREGLFRVVVFGWDDIENEIGKYDEVFAQHYPELVATVRGFDQKAVHAPEGGYATQPQPGASGRPLSVGLAEVLEGEHQAQINDIRGLLKKGQPTLAKEQAEALRARVWATASGLTRARILILLGHAALDLGDEKQAAGLLTQAIDHAPDDPTCQANAAVGFLLIGRDAAAMEWAQKALSKAPTNPLAIQVAVLLDTRGDPDVVAAYESVAGHRSELYTALGRRAAQAGDLIRARSWLEKAIEISSDDPDALATLARVILDQVRATPDALVFVTDEQRRDLQRVVELCTRAWSLLADEEVRKPRVQWLIDLASAKRLLGLRDAGQSADEALRIGGDRDELLLFRAAIAFEAGEFPLAEQLLAKIKGDPEGARGLRAAVKASLGKPADSIPEWETLLADTKLSPEEREQTEYNYVQALSDVDPAKARSVIQGWLEETPTNPWRLLLSVGLARQLGVRPLRDAQLERAVNAAQSSTAAHVLVRLAEELFRAERFGDAADVYGRLIGEVTRETREARRLVEALYRAGRFQTAIGVCARMRATASSPFATEMESYIYEELGDLASARRVCEEQLANDPDDVPTLLRLATIFQRTGDTAKIPELVSRIDRKLVVRNVNQTTWLVQLLQVLGRASEALELLYEMRRLNIDRAEAHLRYVGWHFTHAKEVPLADPITVEAEVAVALEGSGAPEEVLITRQPNPRPEDGEYAPDHAMAIALLGKKVGDEVSFPSKPHQKWRVKSLSSKFAFALRQSLKLLPARFPEQPGIEQHDVPEKTDEFVEQIRERLTADEPYRVAALRYYTEGQVTIGALARALHRSALEAMGVVASSSAGLVGTTNSPKERDDVARLLSDETLVLVADLTAITILDGVGALRSGTLKNRRFAVTQSTLDEFVAVLSEWKSKPLEGYMTLGTDEGRLVRIDVPAEVIRERRERYEHLVSWLKTTCEILPVDPGRAEKHAKEGRLDELLGRSFWDSLLVASENGRTLLSDDLRLRQLFLAEFGKVSACSPLLLHAEYRAGRLSREAYAGAIITVICSGYRTVSIDAVILHAAAKAEGWRTDGRFTRVLDGLKGPETEPVSAAVVAAEFFKMIWLDVLLPQQRDQLCFAVLDTLRVGRPEASVIPEFERRVLAQFALLPTMVPSLRRVIATWKRLRLL